MRHCLSDIDARQRTATCTICGPTRIRIGSSRANTFRCSSPQAIRQHKAGTKPYLLTKGEMCERCGFEPVHSCQLDVHHRDGNHANNEISNLETLCANCHRLTHHGLV